MEKSPVSMYSVFELRAMRDGLVRECDDAARGARNSITFARHAIHRGGGKGPAQVLVVGGTTAVGAIVERSGGRVEVHTEKRETLPVLETAEVLFSRMERLVSQNAGLLGINFAYPLEPLYRDGRLDGVLIRGTKEHEMQGLVGKAVGREFERHLRKKRGVMVETHVANDTVCLVLAGLDEAGAETLAGGVVGTGFNFGYFLDAGTVINLESGNYGAFPQTETGIIIDRESNNPGGQRWEKEVSGGYLYRHYNIYASREDAGYKEISSTAELSRIAQGDDRSALIARSLLERSASLVAVEMAAIYKLKGERPVVFLIEGSLFWNGWKYRETVDRYLSSLGVPAGRITIKRVDNSSLVGAAHLVL